MENKIEAVWNYCLKSGIMNRRDTFDRNVVGDIVRGASALDIAVHISVHGRHTGRTLAELEQDLSEILAA